MSVVNDNFKGEMKKLADSGVNFCLEEYGSGYTDISSVYDLPISMIKINKSVLRAAVRNEKARVTMESTLELAHELSMKTAVSGVEDERYYNLIPDMPCDYATGNYFFEQLDEDFLKTERRLRTNDGQLSFGFCCCGHNRHDFRFHVDKEEIGTSFLYILSQ